MRKRKFRLGTGSLRRTNPVCFFSRFSGSGGNKKDLKGCTYAPCSGQMPASQVYTLEACVIQCNAFGLHQLGMDE